MILNGNKKVGLYLVILITPGAVAALLNHGPIPQALSYHGFADRRVIIMVQFLPMLAIPFILVCFNSLFTRVSG